MFEISSGISINDFSSFVIGDSVFSVAFFPLSIVSVTQVSGFLSCSCTTFEDE